MTKEKQKLNFAGKIAKIFVENSRLSLLLIFTIFAWGVVSFWITPKQYNPEIVAPAFSVITNYNGASSKEIEEIVTKPLEDKIIDIDGVDEVMSRSVDGATSIITVKFFVGEDLERSKIKLTQKVRGNLDERPMGASEPIIKNIDPDNVPVQVIAVSSDLYSKSVLRKVALDIKEKIKNVENTSNIEVFGGSKKALRIELSPMKMNASNISTFEIYQAIKQSNIKMISGEIKNPESQKNIMVEVDAKVKDADDLGNIVLRDEGDQLVYLQDIASIEYTNEEIENYYEFRKKNLDFKDGVVYLSIAKKKGANISLLTKAIREKVKDLEIPKNINIIYVRDEGKTASEEILGLAINLLEAIIIVSVILFLFLKREASLIVTIAIPLVLASVFGIGNFYGQTINRITLFALILSLGLLVDNATVVVENAVRHIKKQKNYSDKDEGRKQAVIEAVNEVGIGLFMSTVTTLLAFYPMAFVTGMMGPYMGPIPFFVPVALIASLFIAFSINPYLSSVLLKIEGEEPEKNKRQNKYLDKILKQVRILKWKIMHAYKKLLSELFLNKKLRKRVLQATFIIFLLVMLLPAFAIVKFRMLPKADREQFYIYLDLPEETHLEKTKEISNRLEDFLLQNEQIVSLQSFIGTAPIVDFNGLFKGSSARNGDNLATIKVNLTHHDKRRITSEKFVEQIRPQIYDLLKNENGLRIQLIEDPPGPPVLATMLIKVKGENYDTLKMIARDMEEMFTSTKGMVDINTSETEKEEKVYLQVDYDKASRSGISSEVIAQTLRIALAGDNISIIHNDKNKEQEYISMRFKKDFRDNLDDLGMIYISNKIGNKVPLTELVEIKKGNIEDILYRDNQESTVYVTAEMSRRSVTYAVIDIYRKLFNYHLPNEKGEIKKVSFLGIDFKDKFSGETYKIEWGGEWKLTVEVFRDLGMAMMIAIFLIYAVLVAQFRSFRTPLLIMITIPLALIGVLPGFAILGYTKGIYFNATSMIGVIALAGIVVNNAIILVEYLNSFRGRGYTAEEALIETGLTRMRPIVLTSLTTILGSLTIVGDPVWAGLAWSIVFGISVSTLLTLVVFPVLYYNFLAKEWDCSLDNQCTNK